MEAVNGIVNSLSNAIDQAANAAAAAVSGQSAALAGKPVVEKPSDRAWWKSGVVYQIYPASFADHAANGHGTLLGIKSKVPYLKSLGVDIVWLSPMYESPQKDMGYDISNYEIPDPRYGTLADWDALKDDVHAHGMKLVMDLVINHTSDEHAWFLESKSSRSNPKRDWYIWRDAKIGPNGERRPPNNWRSTFGTGSAWEWDEGSGQYFLHTFLKEQPDLNWECKELRQELWRMMHYWLKRGSDGFRMDVINFTGKHPEYPDAPEMFEGRETQPFGELSINRPIVHDYLKEMHEEVLQYYDCFCVGECPGGEPVEAYAGYSIPANKELQMVFHFHHQGFDRGQGGFGRAHKDDWKLSELKKIFNYWNVEMEKAGGWNSNYLENHDQPRIVSRVASDHPEDRAKCAKLLSMFHTSLTGTIFIYEGQEIGMCNVPRGWGEEEYKDIETIQHLEGEREWRKKQGQSEDVSDVLKEMRETARDNGRTPMQWDSSANAGFSKATPWMRVHDDYADGWNVAQQTADPNSVWSFWKNMLATRKQYEALIYGKFVPLDEADEEVYAWVRDDPTIGQKMLVVLNLARGADGRGKEVEWAVPAGVDVSGAKVVITNGEAKVGEGLEGGKVKLGKFEGRIYQL